MGTADVGAANQFTWHGEQQVDECVRQADALTLRERSEFDDLYAADQRLGFVDDERVNQPLNERAGIISRRIAVGGVIEGDDGTGPRIAKPGNQRGFSDLPCTVDDDHRGVGQSCQHSRGDRTFDNHPDRILCGFVLYGVAEMSASASRLSSTSNSGASQRTWPATVWMFAAERGCRLSCAVRIRCHDACSPHSVLAVPAQRPLRESAPAAGLAVHGAQPIDG